MSTPFLNFSRIICTNFRQDHASGFWGTGLCGWNCRHTFFAVFPELGDPPAWTRDQLEELNARNIEYNGKRYTRYEINQMQRARERNVRRWKKRYLAETEAGVDTTDSAVRLKVASLAEFAQATGGCVDSARVSVPKFGRSEGSKAAWAPTSPPAAGRKAAQHDNSPAVPVIPVPRGCFCIYDVKPYLDALHRAPELVRSFLEKILAPKQERTMNVPQRNCTRGQDIEL